LILKIIFIFRTGAMYVCLCKGINNRTLRRVIVEGARSVDEVGRRCGAGTACGSCRSDIASLIVDAEPRMVRPGEDALAAK
jgi:bacterioferritin-associated ferredoxin